MKQGTVLAFFFGAILVIAIILWKGYTRAWKNFGTEGSRYSKNYVLPLAKDTVEKRIYGLVKHNPRIYSLEQDASFDNDNWVTLHFADEADSFACVFKFAGDSAQWKKQDSSTIHLFSITPDGRDIHYMSAKNGDLHDTANLYRIFERMVLDSLRTKEKPRKKPR
jgi:hypothetical protein